MSALKLNPNLGTNPRRVSDNNLSQDLKQPTPIGNRLREMYSQKVDSKQAMNPEQVHMALGTRTFSVVV